jgi:putative acetyltransferase
MNIRPYREADLESVALLFTESVHTLAAGHYDPTQCAIWAPIPPEYDAWRERLSTLSTYVAEEGSRLVGFISYKDSGHIELLFTSPANARSGVASALYRIAEEVLHHHGIRQFDTEASLVARPFFERQGFRIEERQFVSRSGHTFQRFAMRKSVSAAGTTRRSTLPGM